MPATPRRLIIGQKIQAFRMILCMEAFRHVQEVLGADLNEREKRALGEAWMDSIQGNRSAFVPLEDI